jgi:predicted nucleotidyltransferase
VEFLLDLADKLSLRWLAAMVADLREAAHGVDPLLVGAAARDVLLSYAHGIPLARATHDADLAFAIPDWTAFDTLRRRLLESGRFQPLTGAVHKLQHRSGIRIDLIPFGGVERSDGSIAWPPEYAEVMGVLGFAEARPSAIEVGLPDDQILHVVALPMLALLKVFAWVDRRVREPRKDAADLFAILTNYIDAGHAERLYGEAAHLLEDSAFDYRVAGAWLAGYDARVLIDRHSQRSDLITGRLISVLAQESDADGPLRLVGEARGIDPEYARRLLSAFLAGFSGKKTP